MPRPPPLTRIGLPPVPDSNTTNHPAELRTAAARAAFLEAAGALHLSSHLASCIALPSVSEVASLRAQVDENCASAAAAILDSSYLLASTGGIF